MAAAAQQLAARRRGRFVHSELRWAFSPEQIAGRLRRIHRDDLYQCASHETIYRDFIKSARNASAIGTAAHALEGFGRHIKTVIPGLSCDRGSEMAHHTALTDATDMPVYFCEPSGLTVRAAVQG